MNRQVQPSQTLAPAVGTGSPELGVGLADVLVQGPYVVPVSVEVLVGSNLLQHPSDRTQDVALVRQQGGARGALQNIKPIRSHDGRVHVAVIHQVPNNL